MSGPDAMRQLTCDEVREMAGAHVLGALDAADEAAMRAHLVGHADAHPEIAELGSVIPAFAEIVPIVEPPDSLKGRILAAAAADLAARGGAAAESPAAAPTVGVPARAAEAQPAAPTSPAAAPGAPTAPAAAPGAPLAAAPPPAAAPVAFPSAEERAARRAQPSAGTWLLRIAAVVAIAVLGGWSLLLQNQLTAAQAYERNVAVVLDTAALPGARTAVLTPDGDTGAGLAALDAAGNLALAMRNLAPTSGAAVYEAWVIGADGVPVPIGSFQVGSSGVGFLETGGLPAADGIVLALTREPGPGATTPTLPIISKGVAGTPG